jgi:putative heme-binding domain-containing protein
MDFRRGVRFVLLCSFGLASSLAAAEPWADPRLTVTAGLELWLDASRLNAAQEGQQRPALKDRSSVEVWWDASGQGRHVRQKAKDEQPQFIQVGPDAVIRFDGHNDHLRFTGPEQSLASITVFVVAAPHTNLGDFRAFLAANAAGQRDYETGFTLDMSAGPTLEFEQVNVEGNGFGGARNLLTAPSPFGTIRVLEASTDADRKVVQLVVDGKPSGERPWTSAPLRVDELTVGARYYNNGPEAQRVSGFLRGDIAEVLIYNRVLKAEESKAVGDYLAAKYLRLKQTLPAELKLPGAGQLLVRVKNPPPVQMLVPGFTVRQLPLDLVNINNVKYRPDGKLFALAYNGDIYLLSDTDGDGLEDKAVLFWDSKGGLRGPIGLALTPPGYKHGNGVFVPSKGKLSLIVDKDGDDKADEEIIVAKGWPENFTTVDTLGVALDKDGAIYFTIGVANFFDAYQRGKDGKSHYEVNDTRGTVQKVSPDFSKRETICTGMRFPVALAFNRQGDLFCTDQEGATWLPNGNPFDELLHIQPGRHYGFPPRHPRHLPNVIDEPSVFDYCPQHQSTCGLNFNEPVNGGPIFGPASWAGDALITGESRGKLYRTQLVKTPAGYVAQNQTIGRLNMLTIDACVSPQGDLVVTTHSGPPDWGTGPTGKGKLYKISYTERERPQPVAVWSSGPQEVRIGFDRPLNPELLKNVTALTKITYGKYVQAADRFESLRPPYAVVQMQLGTPRYDLPVYSVQLASDQRTLILTTAPQQEAVTYAVMLPGLGRPERSAAKAGLLPQEPQVDLDYRLNGVLARWQEQTVGASYSTWLPHLDLEVARAFTRGSAEQEVMGKAIQSGRGTLTLRTRLHLHDMLRPAVQPGSQIDYEWPAEQVTVTFTAPRPFTLNGQSARSENKRSYSASLTVAPKSTEPVPVELVFKVIEGIPDLRIAYHTAEDSRPRALPLHRFLLPWAELREHSTGPIVRREVPELKGGSWTRGRKVFFSEEAGCFKCHAIQGEGGVIGPNLTNLVHRDYASVLRDIAEPSFAINPDYITYSVTLKDGRLLTGSLRSDGDKLLVGDEKGQVATVQRDQVEELHPAPKSIMPENLPKTLGAERMKDLLTYLLNEPPHMPRDAKETPPPPRTRAEVQTVLAGAPKPPLKTRPLRVVLVAGKKDHGPGEHDYPAWQKAWLELLALAEQTTVTTAWEWPAAEDFRAADVLVFYQHGTWTPERARDIDAFLARGGGLVYIHWAVDGNPDAPSFAQRIGLASRGGMIRFRHGPLDLDFTTGIRHPIARNFRKVHFHDESYWRLTGDPQRVQLLASSVEDGEPQPQFWTLEPSKGRVFVSILGHYSWTFDDPLFRILLLRGIAWTAREPVDRFNALATIGARVAE